MKEVKSRTLKLKSAYVTLHEHSAGTSILNVTLAAQPGHVAFWIGDMDEIHALIRFLQGYRPALTETEPTR